MPGLQALKQLRSFIHSLIHSFYEWKPNFIFSHELDPFLEANRAFKVEELRPKGRQAVCNLYRQATALVTDVTSTTLGPGRSRVCRAPATSLKSPRWVSSAPLALALWLAFGNSEHRAPAA